VIVAPLGPRRKGWRTAVRVVAILAVAAIAAAPLAFFSAMLLTPVLWRLEAVVGIELAGHSGPSDWVIELIFALFTIVLFVALLRATSGRSAGATADAPAPEGSGHS
jgi:hypothetical protein